MKTKHTPETLAQLVDELAAIRADLADLKATEEAYRAELIAAGVTEADGTLHRVTISQTTRSITDWQTIAEKFEPSRQLIAAHTKQSAPSFTVRITARKVAR
jgi:hypothetical protein